MKKTRVDLFCERFRDIDQEVIKTLEVKSVKVSLSKEIFKRKKLLLRARNRIRC